jgi:hypothetical protein
MDQIEFTSHVRMFIILYLAVTYTQTITHVRIRARAHTHTHVCNSASILCILIIHTTITSPTNYMRAVYINVAEYKSSVNATATTHQRRDTLQWLYVHPINILPFAPFRIDDCIVVTEIDTILVCLPLASDKFSPGTSSRRISVLATTRAAHDCMLLEHYFGDISEVGHVYY